VMHGGVRIVEYRSAFQAGGYTPAGEDILPGKV
jgi:hypothetical protein